MKRNIKKPEPQQTAYLLGFRQWVTKVKNTPVIIKYPFWQMTAQNPKAVYACINYGEALCPQDIEKQSICLDADIGKVMKDWQL